MTEALELFLRRVIVDQRIPFEIVALDPETFTRAIEASVDDLPKNTPSRRKGKRRGRTRGGS